MKELNSHIKTAKNGPYKGHYLIFMKQCGFWYLYKHRDYESGPDLGYYVFELKEIKSSVKLPDNFHYFKSKVSANKNFSKLSGFEHIKPKEKLPFSVELNTVRSIESVYNDGIYAIYREYGTDSGRTTGFYPFRIRRNRKLNEKLPDFYRITRYESESSAMKWIENQIKVEEKEALTQELKSEAEAQLEFEIKKLKEKLKLLRSSKTFRLEITGIKK